MQFDKNNLYLGNKRTIYKINNNTGICLRDRFGSAEGFEIYLDSDYRKCSEGSDETLRELEERFNKLVKNKTYQNLGFKK